MASLSGIAQPESFEQSLVKLGAELVYSKRFADHHRFTQQEVLNAINRSKKRQAETIITTQKDAVRFPKLDRRDLPIYFMRVEIKILSGANDFQDCVRRICFADKSWNRALITIARALVAWLQALPLRGSPGWAASAARWPSGWTRGTAASPCAISTLCFGAGKIAARKSARWRAKISGASARILPAPSRPPP